MPTGRDDLEPVLSTRPLPATWAPIASPLQAASHQIPSPFSQSQILPNVIGRFRKRKSNIKIPQRGTFPCRHLQYRKQNMLWVTLPVSWLSYRQLPPLREIRDWAEKEQLSWEKQGEKRLQLSTQNGWCFPVLQKGLLQPLLKELLSSPAFILHGNSSQQLLLPKKEALASSEFARPEYLHCNPAPRVTFVQPGARHLTCMPRKTTPHHFKRILTRTCRVHLQTNASLKLSSEYF